MKRTVGLHPTAQARRAREAFVMFWGEPAAEARAAAIAALPSVEWKGRVLRTVMCSGDFGRGPHVVNLPEAVLWCLLSLEVYRCPFHS